MNKEKFLSELSKAISVGGRVSVERYCKTLDLVEAFISSNYSKPLVSGSLPSDDRITQVAIDECSGQNWNDLKFKDVYIDGFKEGAVWMRGEAGRHCC